jgi:hypothetical protein
LATAWLLLPVRRARQREIGRYVIAVIGEEPRLAYSRVLLSSVLAGEARANAISLKPGLGGAIGASPCATEWA